MILSLSPNHGHFGNDGIYSESEISLQTLLNRWSAESWGEYIFLVGAVIWLVLARQALFLIYCSDGYVTLGL